MDNTESHGTGDRYSKEEIELVLHTLIDCDNKVAATITELEATALKLDDDEAEIAARIIDWINESKQKPRNRCIYDIRRTHYNRMLEIILEDKGITRLIQIVSGPDDASAQKAIEKLHDITKGKPTQKIELTGFVTQGEIQQAVEAEIIKSPDGQWVNPEDALSAPTEPSDIEQSSAGE